MSYDAGYLFGKTQTIEGSIIKLLRKSPLRALSCVNSDFFDFCDTEIRNFLVNRSYLY